MIHPPTTWSVQWKNLKMIKSYNSYTIINRQTLFYKINDNTWRIYHLDKNILSYISLTLNPITYATLFKGNIALKVFRIILWFPYFTVTLRRCNLFAFYDDVMTWSRIITVLWLVKSAGVRFPKASDAVFWWLFVAGGNKLLNKRCWYSFRCNCHAHV